MRKSGGGPAAAWLLSTNATATVEGIVFPDAALAHQEQLDPVPKIAVFLPSADEQIGDARRIRDLLNVRLTLKLRSSRLPALGTGCAPNPRCRRTSICSPY